MEETYLLPEHGLLTFHPDSKLNTSSALRKTRDGQQRVDTVLSESLYYLDTFGHSIAGDLGGQAAYMLKEEKFRWEIIPLGEVAMIDFDRGLLDIGSEKLIIQAVDIDGFTVDAAPLTFSSKTIHLNLTPGVYKLKLFR